MTDHIKKYTVQSTEKKNIYSNSQKTKEQMAFLSHLSDPEYNCELDFKSITNSVHNVHFLINSHLIKLSELYCRSHIVLTYP